MPAFFFLNQPTDVQIDETLSLYRLAGWWQSSGATDRDREQVRGIINGSHCFLVATDDAREEAPIIGMGRSISDGVSDAYIQDVAVVPAWRGRGIATEIIGRILRRLQNDAIEWIGLIAERNTKTLYQPLGFSPMADSVPMLHRRK
jgi:spermidine synthase